MASSVDRLPTLGVALVTGVGRRRGIGFTVAERLAGDGFDVGFNFWRAYDERMSYGADLQAADELNSRLHECGRRAFGVEANLEEPASVSHLFDQVQRELGAVSVMVMCHCESVASRILDTTVESFDRHFAVNARASWLLMKEFALRYSPESGCGRIIALTSDHTVDNVPYGASKGALERMTLAAAREFAGLGITANVINPGPIDTGWMTAELRERVVAATALGRLGVPEDVANLVSFLCSKAGGWINGQLLESNGGLAL